MSVSNTDLKFFLTDISPLTAQIDPSQSLGGYASETLLSDSTTLSAFAGRLDPTLSLTDSVSVESKPFLLINDEILTAGTTVGDVITPSVRGSLSTISRVQPSGTPVFGLGLSDLFNNDFNDVLKQYRCIAIQNTNPTYIASSVSLYLRYGSLNPSSSFRFAIERPMNDAFAGAVTEATILSITDTTVPAGYVDNAFVGAIATFTSGVLAGTIVSIASYDQETKTFTFTEQLPSVPVTGVTYLVSAGPSQRVFSGTVEPQVDTDWASSFSTASNNVEAVSININSGRINGSDLHPHDTVYLWIERSLQLNELVFNDNRVVFAVRYST